MGDMIGMMKSFFADLWKYRSEVGKQDAWIRRHAANKGWSVNPRWMIYTNLKLWIIDSNHMFGKRICPCFEPSGDAELDRQLICPCTFAEAEIEKTGWCHCTLFGRGDLTADDYKRAEAQLMSEYRGVPLKIEGRTLDTRGQHIDELRGLPVPDALHQVKRALGGLGLPLSVIVATRVEADHLELLAKSKGIAVSTGAAPDHVLVHLGG